MAHSVHSSSSLLSDSSNAASALIKKRESMFENYHPVLSMSGDAMLDGLRDGTCTIRDPRACFHFRDLGADVACCYTITISKEYFDALVWDRRIRNNTTVVLVDTEHNSYTIVQVVDRKREQSSRKSRVDDRFAKVLCSTSDECKSDLDCLTLYYKFVQSSVNNKRDHAGDNERSKRLRTYSAENWRKYILKKKKEYDCQRNLDLENNTLSAMRLCTGVSPSGSDAVIRKKAVPMLMIEHAWDLRPTDDTE